MGEPADVAVIGGGLVGLATARALGRRGVERLVVLEAESDVAAHQSGHNSGVIHSGLYYQPGSLKARNCVAGREALYEFCAERSIAHERCGKLVVATVPAELPTLEVLARRGAANGIAGIRRLRPEEARELEPNVACLAALHVPVTGIVDYPAVAQAYAADVRAAGGEVRTSARVTAVRAETGGMVLETPAGAVHARHIVACAGLQSDRIARLCGVEPGMRIVPFRGEYYELLPEHRGLVRNLVYPVPDPRFPFLGVHFTRLIHGGIEAGPNAVLALRREGYRRWSLSLRDVLSWLLYGGFWRLTRRYGRMGLHEIWRSLSKGAFVKSMRTLIPAITRGIVRRAGAGVRAQALAPDGRLVDDFHLVEAPRMIHVLNAPSPAATASLAIGDHLADLAVRHFELRDPAK